jgi:outer membrane lipoprotein carrier protein
MKRGAVFTSEHFVATTLLLMLALPLSAGSGSVNRPDRLGEVLAEMKTAGNRLETLRAGFVQTDHDYILGDEETSSGELFLAVPGRIRWEYAEPAPRVLLVRDELVRLFNPTANQVQEFERSEGRGGGAELLVGFGKSNEAIGENYEPSLVEETDEAVTLKLVPKPDSPVSIFTAIELTLTKTSWTPVQSVFHEPNRDRTVIEFRDVEINVELPKEVFELDLPPNVEIVRN